MSAPDSTAADVPPSGRQFRISYGTLTATVVEVGGGLRELTADGRPLVDGYPVSARCDGARGQSLLPWPNRIADGRYTWRGAEHRLPLTEPDAGCAIHGLVRWVNWRCVDHQPDRVVLGYRLPAQPGYPWTLDLLLDYRVGPDGLLVRTSALNRAERAAPFAAGAHPYLTVGTPRIDDGRLELPATRYLPTDGRGLPTGVREVSGSAYDFRTARRIGDTRVDLAFTGLARAADGTVRARLLGPDGSAGVELWMDRAYRYVEVFTGDSLPDAARRRTGLGVEPMTAPPNAFDTGVDLETLEPGVPWNGSWGIRSL